MRDGDQVIAPVNRLAAAFEHVVPTQDWHPPGHVSFASAHPGKRPLDSVTLPDGCAQALWMDHCVQGSRDVARADRLAVAHAEWVIRKGYGRDLDSCSAFVEADGATNTGLAGYLRERRFTKVFDAGLATDFCAGFTAIDAAPPASRQSWRRTPRAASTPTARWRGPSPTWTRPA